MHVSWFLSLGPLWVFLGSWRSRLITFFSLAKRSKALISPMNASHGMHRTMEALWVAIGNTGVDMRSLTIQPPGVQSHFFRLYTSWIHVDVLFLLIPWFIFQRISSFSVGNWDVNHWNGPEGQQTNLGKTPIFVRDVIYVISHGPEFGTSWNLHVLQDFNSLISVDLI